MKRLVLLFIIIVGLFSCASAPIVAPPVNRMYKYRAVPAEENYQNFQLVPVYIDKDFTPSDRLVIDQAIREWNYVLNGYVKIQIVSDKIDHDNKEELKKLVRKLYPSQEGVIMFKLNHDHEMIEGLPEKEDGSIRLAYVNGLGDRGHLFVVINDAIGTKNLHKIVLHEFGHLMGADHVQVPSLMFPYYGKKQFNCIDKITAALVAEAKDLDLAHMNYCSVPSFE